MRCSNMPAQLVTFNEAKKYLRVSPATLYRLIHTKKLPALKVGDRWRFRQERLDKWLDSRETTRKKSK